MGNPKNCGDCSIASRVDWGKVSCPLTDQVYAWDKGICYDAIAAKKWWADSIARILWLGEWLSWEVRKSRGIPPLEEAQVLQISR